MLTEIPASCLWERKNVGQMNSLILYYEFIDSGCAVPIQWLLVGKGVPSFMVSTRVWPDASSLSKMPAQSERVAFQEKQ